MGASGTSYIIEGPATIYYGAGNCNATEYLEIITKADAADLGSVNATILGVTETGVTISTQLMTHRISADDYGGNEGPPAELLILGASASIQGTLVKWGKDAFEDLKAGLRNVTPGHVPWPAHGVFGGSGQHLYAFWVVGSKRAFYFPKCELATQPREWQISVLERRMNLNITAYAANVFGIRNQNPHIFYTPPINDPEDKVNALFPSCDSEVNPVVS